MTNELEPLIEKLIDITELLAKEVKALVESERSKINNRDQATITAHRDRVNAIQEAISQLRPTADTKPHRTGFQKEVQS